MFDKSASVAAGILEYNPQYPGALHYLIHANNDPDYSKLSKIAADQYAKVAINEEIATVETLVIGAELDVSDNGIALCSAGPTRYAPNQSDIYKAIDLVNQMKAMITILEGDDNKTEGYLIASTDFEDKSEYSYEPPDISLPSYEQYGEWLLTKNRPEDAITQFDRRLKMSKIAQCHYMVKSKH